jgi:hypothetical protein
MLYHRWIRIAGEQEAAFAFGSAFSALRPLAVPFISPGSLAGQALLDPLYVSSLAEYCAASVEIDVLYVAASRIEDYGALTRTVLSYISNLAELELRDPSILAIDPVTDRIFAVALDGDSPDATKKMLYNVVDALRSTNLDRAMRTIQAKQAALRVVRVVSSEGARRVLGMLGGPE